MSETEIIHEEPNIPDTPITSEEDKFFGKTTEVDASMVEGLEVEVVAVSYTHLRAHET